MRQPRSVTYLYGGVALALLLVIATVALVLVPPSAPSVAEFAPRAEEQIKDAPDVQSSRFGSGTGACGAGQLCEGPDLTPPPTTRQGGSVPREIVRARVRRCVGDPPRQTEDPQSPPCVNYWEGDSGGTTSRGVTRDEILVGFTYTNSEDETGYHLLAEHFNRRYELYGRKLRVMRLDGPSGVFDEAPRNRGYAADANERGVFAAIGQAFDPSEIFVRELSRMRIVNVEPRVRFESTADHNAFAPYAWSYAPTMDDTLRNAAEFACRSLVGRPARWAGGLTSTRTRHFGIGYDQDLNLDHRPLSDGLRRCGAEVEIYALPATARSRTGGASPEYFPIAAQVQADGVTTFSCVCTYDPLLQLSDAAEQNGYQPEWLDNGLDGMFPKGEANASRWFGLGSGRKDIPLADSPTFYAMHEVDPDYTPGFTQTMGELIGFYESMLVLVSGIQMAGPYLTPENLERALFTTRFPNPHSGAAPYWQAGVGFRRGDHAFVDDFHLHWWGREVRMEEQQNDARYVAATQGGSCYIDRGARWKLGAWPLGEPSFFDRTKPCR